MNTESALYYGMLIGFILGVSLGVALEEIKLKRLIKTDFRRKLR